MAEPAINQIQSVQDFLDPKIAKGQKIATKAWRYYERSQSSKAKNEQANQARKKAKRLAEQILEMPSFKNDALNLLGRIALDEGFYAKAENLLEQALKADPDNPGYLYSRGHVALAKQEFLKAVEYFEQSLQRSRVPDQTRAASSLAYTRLRMGQTVEAFDAYRKLIRSAPHDDHIRAKLFECTGKIEAHRYDEELANDVCHFLKLEGADFNSLAKLAASLIICRYNLNSPLANPIEYYANGSSNVDQLANDELLVESLNKIYFTNPLIELFIRKVRKQLLLECLTESSINPLKMRLVSALTLHAANNEFVYALDDQEEAMITALRDLIIATTKIEGWKPADLFGAVMLYAMYEQLALLPNAEELAHHSINRWPVSARTTIKYALLDVFDERAEAQHIPCFKPITNQISLAVQNQYESNPYPRWMHLSFNTPTNYGRALEAELIGFRAPSYFNSGALEVLIAGAGTGKHALHVAKYFRNVNVTAVDLSRQSLAYAKRMARRYHIQNISFMQADILDLDELNRTFHVIECSGVLHHMESPERGAQILVKLLKPEGLIKLGLYSEMARDVISRCRAVIERNQLQPQANDIRLFRTAILNQAVNTPFEGILASPDFYNMSGCRDLLFHVQEHLFSPDRIRGLSTLTHTRFLGFLLNPEIKAKYRQEHPGDVHLINLNYWKAFERNHPNIFGGMYQFYLQNQ